MRFAIDRQRDHANTPKSLVRKEFFSFTGRRLLRSRPIRRLRCAGLVVIGTRIALSARYYNSIAPQAITLGQRIRERLRIKTNIMSLGSTAQEIN
jgi:hypothetical protein